MADYPYYFCHGTQYHPPNSYYRVDSPTTSVVVLPANGAELAVNYPIEYFLQEREGRGVTAVSTEEIDASLEKWIIHNRPTASS
jgi:hypothetical protein